LTGAQRGVERGEMSQARNHWRAPKSHNNVASTSIQYIYSQNTVKVRTRGRQTCFLPRAPSMLRALSILSLWICSKQAFWVGVNN